MHELTSQQVATGQTIADAITGAEDLDTLRKMLNLLWQFAIVAGGPDPTDLAKQFGVDFSALPKFSKEPREDDGWSWDRYRILVFTDGTTPWALRWRSDLADSKIREIFRDYFRSIDKPFRRHKDGSVAYKDNDCWLLFAWTSQDAIERLHWMASA